MITFVVILACALILGPQISSAAKGDWLPARATFFDAPDYWKAEFKPGFFGDLYGNSCQYQNRRLGVPQSNADFPLPIDAVGAVTDMMTAHIGSCGKCFEVRCRTGPILYKNGTLTTDVLRRPSKPNPKDPEGTESPALNPDLDPSIWWTKCRNEDTSIVITIIDSCPCTYIGGRQQKFCCGPLDHFDLSFWAFNRLAHPGYSMMMLEYRPVDCNTHEPLDDGKLDISSKIYVDRPQPGWGWGAYFEKESIMIANKQGRGGSAATCVRLTPGGGLAFWCRDCQLPGAQPFNRDFIQFWVRSNAQDTHTFTPPGKAPKLQVFLSQLHDIEYSTTGAVKKPERFCHQQPYLVDYTPLARDGDWFQFRISIVDFQCKDDLSPSTVNRLVFRNPGKGKEGDAVFCLDDIEII